ncbi:MAG: peptide deformylase, partial [Cyanobacteria bacterium]|nr:peptide deformylase [Cyanobacteriota bacterium]
MPVRSIIVYPDPQLKLVSAPVDPDNDDLTSLIQDLVDTMNDAPGCVGVAAPQIGVKKRVMVIDASRNKRVESRLGFRIVINPLLVSQEGEVIAREGCLSLPDLTANVKRAKEIEFDALDENFVSSRLSASDFEARLILHEIDHFDGV